MMRTLLVAALAIGGSALVTPAAAQQGRGLPWVGCWAAADGIEAQSRVCVVPQGERDLRIVTLDAEGKATESTLQLNGERIPISSGDCTGWEKARLSEDGDRILIDAQLRCGDQPQRTNSTAFVMTPAGYWLQVNGSGIARIANARIRLYRPVESYAEFPADIRAAVSPFVVEAEQARYAMLDRAVSAKDLVELDAMGVSAPVIDLIVAASYPKTFVIDAEGAASTVTPIGPAPNDGRASMNSPFYWSNGFPMLSYHDMLVLRNCMRSGAFACQMLGSRFGYSSFGNGGCDWLFGAGCYGGYWPGAGLPVVVRPNAPPADVPGSAGGGRAVRGRGYTSSGDGSVGTRTASPRSGTDGTTQSSGSSGASSGSAGSGGSSGSSGSSGGETRTAKPRSP